MRRSKCLAGGLPMLHRNPRRLSPRWSVLFYCALCALLWPVSSARAASIEERFRAYADHNNLKVRALPLRNGGQRLFAPVTPASLASFRELANPGLIINLGQIDEH